MFRVVCLGCALILVLGSLSCGRSVKEEQIEVKASNDPLFPARTVLQRYAEGQALGSEVTSFPKMVEDVRKVDAGRAGILEKGLEQIQKAPAGERPALAKGLLQKLQPAMK